MKPSIYKSSSLFALLALIFGSICLFYATVLAIFLLPNASVSEYSPLAIPVLLGGMIVIFTGPPFAILSFVFGAIALCRFPNNRERAFSIIGIVGGVLLPIILILFFALSLALG